MAQFGISVALLTPFGEDGGVDGVRLLAHASRVLDAGADSVTLFGTTGEGASVGGQERAQGLAALLGGGIAPDKIILGLYATAPEDAVAQAAEAARAGVRDFLLPPPFYFKGVGDDGLFDWHARVIAGASAETRFILYHIPQVTGVALSPALVARLAAAFPGRIRAVKDSSGDWENAQALLAQNSLPVLVGDERLLHRAVKLGCPGAISGMANLHPARMKRIVATAEEDAALSAETAAVVAHPVIPAIKALQARATSDSGWEAVRPPLAPLADDARASLFAAVRAT